MTSEPEQHRVLLWLCATMDSDVGGQTEAEGKYYLHTETEVRRRRTAVWMGPLGSRASEQS